MSMPSIGNEGHPRQLPSACRAIAHFIIVAAPLLAVWGYTTTGNARPVPPSRWQSPSVTHRSIFTLYPPGWTLYSRKPLVQVALDCTPAKPDEEEGNGTARGSGAGGGCLARGHPTPSPKTGLVISRGIVKMCP